MYLIKAALLAAAFLVATPVFADGAPSDSSVRELMRITEAQKIMDSSLAQMDGYMQSAMKQTLAGQKLTPEQEAVMVETRGKLVALFKEDMAWSSMEPALIGIYSQSFSQKEIDSMIEFYKSEAGQAVIAKMPLVMQGTMQVMQSKMEVLGPRLQQIMQESVERMKATKGTAPKNQ